jgi:ADP-dependent NAD(P)H-hydrate dehydratase
MPTPIVLNGELVQNLYQPIAPDTHKGRQGHALLIGGSYGKMGSVCLSSAAAIKSGCGLVTAFIPKCGYEIVQIAIPEVMVVTDRSEEFIATIGYDFVPHAIGIGMGMGQQQETHDAFHDFLVKTSTHLVVDADALNILSTHKDWLSLLPKKTILTPHKKELERLIGVWNSDDELWNKVTAFSKAFDVIVVVKGAPTQIVDSDTIYKNTTGNAALATAGSGDVLTGIITSLVAQGYVPLHAALLGVYLHGLTADLALPETGTHSFIASDIIRYLGKAFLTFEITDSI